MRKNGGSMMATNAEFFAAPTETQEEAPRWEPIVISSKLLRREIERLTDLPRPSDGRRETLIVHPKSTSPGRGLTPGIQVRLSVLKPGERTEPFRHNATEVNFCIEGAGRALVGGRRFSVSRYDVWNHPAWCSYVHANESSTLQVRLTYSNAALLEQLNVHIVDPRPPTPDEVTEGEVSTREDSAGAARRSRAFQLTPAGAWLMSYEELINPPVVASRPLHWPWALVKEQLDKLAALGAAYHGRRLYLLYNPITGRTNGTTPNFFSTMTVRPPSIVDRPHRHVSAAINYYFSGRGYSLVEGKRYEWESGDLMFSAPGWAVHNHASHAGESVYELTVQDQPFHLATESLLWQEDLERPAILLGARTGFATNRDEVES
jgi:gentisate 1,2-dioxygenase